MKFKLFITLVVFTILTIPTHLKGQKVTMNEEIETTNYGKMLVGPQNISQFDNEPYSKWFKIGFIEYQPNEVTLSELKNIDWTNTHITIFLGTWCGDSHREFPRFLKLLNSINFPEEKISIIALDRQKKSPNGIENILGITRVPSIIFTKNHAEIGRIVEFPITGFLEKDMLNILNSESK